VLDTLAGMKNLEYEKYLTFYAGFGPTLKEGLARDFANREKIADLLLFESTSTEPGKFTTLADYVAKMPADQSDIYYLTGESAEQLRRSPYLEAFRAKGRDVLLLTDPVDEFAIPGLHSYKGKQLKAADRADTGTDDSVSEDLKERFAPVILLLKGMLPEVADVRLTTRLTESAACLVSEGAGTSAHFERLMERMGREAGGQKRVLELNPSNAAVEALRDLHIKDSTDPRLAGYARLLYEQAVIAEGSPIADPIAFARRVNELIARDAK
jgi:molecular chaperone HtpG